MDYPLRDLSLKTIKGHKMFGTNKRLDNIQEQLFEIERKQLLMLSKLQELKEGQKKIRGKRKPMREPLSRKKGYTNTTPEERKQYYEMYKQGVSMTDIASHFNRSQSCVSKNIFKILKEKGEVDESTLGEAQEQEQ